MHRASTLLIGLTLFAQAAVARAADAAPAATAAPAAPVAPVPAAAPASEAPAVASESTPPAAPRRFQVGLQFLPMVLGELNTEQAGLRASAESRVAPGVGLSLGFDVFHGLILGVAPQIITGAKPRDEPQKAGNELDLMVRVAYRYAIPGVAALYAEVLPGYSIYSPVASDASKGFVLAGGVGCEIDLSERAFANVGLGYQKGWQSQTATTSYQTSFVRVALGAGARF
jgi:hypothetical protein